MDKFRRLISLISITMMILSASSLCYAEAEGTVDVQENDTIVNLSDMTEDNAVSDELLVLVEEGTSTKEVRGIADEAGASLDNISTLGDGTKLAKISIDVDTDAEDVATEIAADDSILIVQPNFVYYIDEEEMSEENVHAADPQTETVATPNDKTTYSQWYLEDDYAGSTKGKAAREELTQTENTVTVAVIDTGVKRDHIDLDDNILSDKCVTFNLGKRYNFDNTPAGEGYKADPDKSEDDKGHGTHVCGLIAAEVEEEPYGIEGIAANRAKLIVIDAALTKMYDYGFTTEDVVLGIDYAVKEGAEVINMSLGGIYRDYIMEEAIEYATQNGALCVCASGNEASQLRSSPGDSRSAIGVISHRDNGEKANKSNYGVNRDISAPGVDIWSTYKDGKYEKLSGTSMATPLVSGLAALIKSEKKELGPRELKNLLYTSSGNGSFDNNCGFGRINAVNAIANVNADDAEPETIVLNSNVVSLCEGEEFDLEYAVYPGAASRHADELTFSTNDPEVVSVDENGKITAKAQGTATITAECCDVKAQCKVSVTDIYEPISYPYSGNKSFSSDDHYLTLSYVDEEGKAEYYEVIVDGYEFEVDDETDRVEITVNGKYAEPSLMLIDPSGNEVSLDQEVTETGSYETQYTCEAGTDIVEAGIYRLRVMGELNGEYQGDINNGDKIEYRLIIKKINYNPDIKDISDAEISGITNRTYTGTAINQEPKVVFEGETLKNETDYELSYKNNINAGTATVIISGKGDYSGTVSKTFTIGKTANGLKVKRKTVKVKKSKLKKGAVKLKVRTVLNVDGANGPVSYAKVSGSKKLKISEKTGKVTVKKKTKKGTYKMVVAVKAAGDRNHNAATKKVTIKIKVK